MTGRVQRADDDRAQLELPAVIERLVVVLGRGRSNSAVLFRNPTISGVVPPESTKR